MITQEDIIPNYKTVSQKLSKMVELLKKVVELEKELDELGFTLPFYIDLVKKD